MIASALDLLRAANPGKRIDLEVQGDTLGSWDSLRLQQLLGNLVSNAINYGAQDAPVYATLNGDAKDLSSKSGIADLSLDHRISLESLIL